MSSVTYMMDALLTVDTEIFLNEPDLTSYALVHGLYITCICIIGVVTSYFANILLIQINVTWGEILNMNLVGMNTELSAVSREGNDDINKQEVMAPSIGEHLTCRTMTLFTIFYISFLLGSKSIYSAFLELAIIILPCLYLKCSCYPITFNSKEFRG